MLTFRTLVLLYATSLVGAITLLFEIIVLFGVPDTGSDTIRSINYFNARSSSNSVITKLENDVGLPNYIAFSLLGYCIADGSSQSFTQCRNDYGSGNVPILSDHLHPNIDDIFDHMQHLHPK